MELARSMHQFGIAIALERHQEMLKDVAKRRKEIQKRGIFFFDLEGDILFQDEPSFEIAVQKMKMTVGVGFDGREYISFFGDKPDDLDKLGKCFDDAKEIVIFGHHADV